MEQANIVETSKGADAGLTVGCQVVSAVYRLLLGSEGSQCCLPHLDFLYKVVYSSASANYSKSGH